MISCWITEIVSMIVLSCLLNHLSDTNAPEDGGTTCENRMLRMREAADGLQYGRVSPRYYVSGHLLSHSNSFSFETEKDTAGCRTLNRNFIVGGSTGFWQV